MKFLPFTILFLALILTGFAQNATIRSKHFNTENNLAIQGYDPVAYFTLQKAVKGNPSFAAKHLGVIYHFSSQTNKDLFLKNPNNYEPQYGGWCAYALGEKGEKVEINPETFKIIDNKLYLFYNANFNNTLKTWNKNEVNLKNAADLNWNKIIN